MFATWLRVERQVAPRTVAGYLSTVLAWHRRQFGEMLPDGRAHRLSAVLRGMRRDEGQRAKKHVAVTPQTVARLIEVMMDERDVDVVTLCAAVAVAFCGLLRVSEFCVKAGREFDGAALPIVRELRNVGDEVTFDIWPRKKGARVRGKEYSVSVRDGTRIRPASLLRRMRELRQAQRTWQGAMPLFVVGQRALDELLLNKFLRAACGRLGMAAFTAHSLRVGGATAAMAAGVDTETIKMLGRWDSGAYRVYCRLSRQAAMRMSRAVASADVSLRGVASG